MPIRLMDLDVDRNGEDEHQEDGQRDDERAPTADSTIRVLAFLCGPDGPRPIPGRTAGLGFGQIGEPCSGASPLYAAEAPWPVRMR